MTSPIRTASASTYRARGMATVVQRSTGSGCLQPVRIGYPGQVRRSRGTGDSDRYDGAVTSSGIYGLRLLSTPRVRRSVIVVVLVIVLAFRALQVLTFA